jgi:hypothetical protein
LIEALKAELENAYRYRLAMPTWYVTKDSVPPTLQTQELGTIVEVPSGVYPARRVCYHCDATDGVTGVVPLCRKCR